MNEIEKAESDDREAMCRKNGGSLDHDECTATRVPPKEFVPNATPEGAAGSMEEAECDDQGALCRKNGGTVDECSASMRACKEAVSGGPPQELLSDATPEGAMTSMEETECNDQAALCRKNGGSVDECTASTRACKEAVSGGPPQERLSDVLHEETVV